MLLVGVDSGEISGNLVRFSTSCSVGKRFRRAAEEGLSAEVQIKTLIRPSATFSPGEKGWILPCSYDGNTRVNEPRSEWDRQPYLGRSRHSERGESDLMGPLSLDRSISFVWS